MIAVQRYFANCYKCSIDNKIVEHLGKVKGILEGYLLVEFVNDQGLISHDQFGICAGKLSLDKEVAETYIKQRKAELLDNE